MNWSLFWLFAFSISVLIGVLLARRRPDTRLGRSIQRIEGTPILFAGYSAAMFAVGGFLVGALRFRSAVDGLVIGVVCFGVTLVASFRARARDTKRGGGHVRLVGEEYQEAETRAYHPMDFGLLLWAWAFVIAVGVVVLFEVWS